MKLKRVTTPQNPSITSPLSYQNMCAIRYCLYDNEPGTRATRDKLDGRSRYKFEVQIWNENKTASDYKLIGWLSAGKVFNQTRHYKRLSQYKNWYEDTWQRFKNATQSDLSSCDFVGYTCLGLRQQNGASNGYTLVPKMAVLVALKHGHNPYVDFVWDDLDDQENLDTGKNKDGYDIYYHWKPVELA